MITSTENETPDAPESTKQEFVHVPLRLEKKQDERVTEAALKNGMSKQAVMRLSIERGLEVLLKALAN